MTPRSGDGAHVVSRSNELAEALGEAKQAGVVALDTEFLREKTYSARLCLAQLAVDDRVWLLDPLDGLDMAPVAGLLSDPEVEVVVHAGAQDLELFHGLFGTRPRRVFDVQKAAGFAGYGASLPYGRLVSEVLGVSLAKGESYTDWCRRPLSAAQLSYAADDVRFLVPAAQALRAKLEGLGRLDWAEEEMRAIEAAASRGPAPEEAWRRVSGRGSLSPRGLTILRELAAWREREAMRRDIPRNWVVRDQTLVEIARRGVATRADLGRIRGLKPQEAERSAEAMLAAVRRGSQAPVIRGPATPSHKVQVRARMLTGIADALLRLRSDAAGVASELVASRADLEALVADVLLRAQDPANHRLLRGWRRELAGDAIVDLIRGRIALRVVDAPPYIEEVRL